MIELARHHRLPEAGLLVGLLIVTALAGRWLLRDLRVHPAGFPAATASHGLRIRTEPRHMSEAPLDVPAQWAKTRGASDG
jgi:hypothetical protein